MSKYVIYGPPGTGKSTEIVKRVNQYIDKEFNINKIGLCSFTKAAAIVLKDKIDKNIKMVGTIHSFAFKQADISKTQVVSQTNLKEFADIFGVDISGASVDDSDSLKDGDHYLALYSLARNTLKKDIREVYDSSEMPGVMFEFIFFTQAYEKWKKTNGLIDYNDMLELALEHEAPDLDVLFIDEAQDLSNLQWKVVDHWAKNIKHIHISGDDDQAIYEWNGADPLGMSKFENKYNAKRTVLSQSYRVPLSGHTIALSLVPNIDNRVVKEYKPTTKKGIVNYHDDYDFIEHLDATQDTLILYRAHKLRKNVEEELITMGLPYWVDNGKKGMLQKKIFKSIQFFEKLKMKDFTYTKKEFESFLSDLQEDFYFQVKNKGPEILNKMCWDDVLSVPIKEEEYYTKIADKYGVLYFDKNNTPEIHISSIHGSKGREASRVVLINDVGMRTLDNIENGVLKSAEARIFYVAVTRTSDILDIVNNGNSVGWF